ncbi:hypothetical protein [Pontibacillus sp. ALD_SL1]|uniref:hypothetical protein n=1 Tax=Pontibacillus sp. ALD_SL1 TaxID=2777185 RepID=UPI001F608491|nr:hypothetical protein [Pontibacillus sp. ALD_SL1]
MLIIGFVKPRETAYQMPHNPSVEMTPWKYAMPTSIFLFACVGQTYIVFSPIGVAYTEGIVSSSFWPATAALAGLTIVCMLFSLRSWNEKYMKSTSSRSLKQKGKNLKEQWGASSTSDQVYSSQNSK